MVRLEKVLWESAVNVAALGRARVISTPSKFFNENRNDAFKVAAHRLFNQGLTGVILRAVEPILAKFTYRWYRDIALQRGLALEDFFLFQDRQLRRCFFFEAVMRQSFHPYQWVFFKRRRARYYKVERALRGFYVPQWAREEGERRTLAETLENKEVFENFLFQEYMSDITPTGRWSILSKWNPLDLFMWYGTFKVDAWDRHFHNEAFYEGVTKEEVRDAVLNPFNGVNLKTSEGRRRFEEEVSRLQKLYPGAVTREGEKFDFNKFYSDYSAITGNEIKKV